MRYEESYVRAFPFDRMVEGMLQPEMILETIEIVRVGLDRGVLVNLIINNRAGGNAPLIAQIIAEKLAPQGQMNLW